MIYLRLDAGHDKNGNGRRLYLVFDEEGETVDVIDEGCVGPAEVRKRYPDAHDAGSIMTTPMEYRSLLSLWKAKEARAARDKEKSSGSKMMKPCSMCKKPIDVSTAYVHQGDFVGECCWDERL